MWFKKKHHGERFDVTVSRNAASVKALNHAASPQC